MVRLRAAGLGLILVVAFAGIGRAQAVNGTLLGNLRTGRAAIAGARVITDRTEPHPLAAATVGFLHLPNLQDAHRVEAELYASKASGKHRIQGKNHEPCGHELAVAIPGAVTASANHQCSRRAADKANDRSIHAEGPLAFTELQGMLIPCRATAVPAAL